MPGHYIEGQDSPVDEQGTLEFDDDGELIGARIVGARCAGFTFARARRCATR